MSLAIRRLAEALVTMLARIRHHYIVCPFILLRQLALESKWKILRFPKEMTTEIWYVVLLLVR